MPDDDLGLEVPGGTFGLNVTTSLDGAFGAGLYEDGRANQHLYGDSGSQAAGRINFTFIPSGTTVVDAIHLSGFEPGTRLFIGEPGEPGTIELTVNDAGQPVNAYGDIFTFTHGQFTGPGVYILPPDNSDRDMSVTAQIDLRAQGSGLTTTLSGEFTIVVDAVADRPEGLSLASDYGDAEYAGESTLTAFGDGKGAVAPETAFTNNGWAGHVLSGVGTLAEARAVTFTVTATFGDYADGSEEHFVLVKVPAAEAWVIEGAEIVSFQVDADGAIVYANADGTYPPGTTTAQYYKVPVSSDDIQMPWGRTIPARTGPASSNRCSSLT